MAVSAATVLSVAAPAYAFDFNVSGQVDRAVTAASNGDTSDIGFVDNTGSNTRFRFTGEQDMDNGMTVGFAYEIALGENASSTFDVDNGGGSNADFFDNRLANVFISGTFGKLTFGKVDGAANGTSEVDYSGTTYLGGGVDYADYAGGISFLDDQDNAIASLGQVNNEFDALSRQNAVRYDTPSLGGFVLSTSLDNGHAYEVAGRYENEFSSGIKFGAAVDYVDNQSQGRDIAPNGQVISDGDRFHEYGGSTSLLLPFGLNLTGSYKKHDFVNDRPSAENYYGSVGYIIGKNKLAVSYGRTDDLLNDGSEFEAYGLAYVYSWTKSIDLYSSYHHYMLDHAAQVDGPLAGQNVKAQDIDNIYAGVRLKFL